MTGLTNSEYAGWLNDVASVDCGDVTEIYIKYSNNDDQYLDTTEICDWMENTNSTTIATIDEIKYSGGTGDGAWYAIDERVTSNLERTENENSIHIPVNIKRPTGG